MSKKDIILKIKTSLEEAQEEFNLTHVGPGQPRTEAMENDPYNAGFDAGFVRAYEMLLNEIEG